MRKYFLISMVTLLVGLASAASGIYLYKANTPKPLRLGIRVICPRCEKFLFRQFTKAEQEQTNG